MSGSSNKGWWHQPATVWAVAFAATVSFMGVGLVDPILPAIAEELHASAAQTSLLFTSYLLITAIAMFFSSWVSGRLGAKNTLLLGLALIVVFALASGLSPSVPWIIAFRAVWGLGNALFLSTALATIISEAREAGGAIILYEAALGIGMALGPLAGGLLGTISWRAPFIGTSVLMLIAFVAIAVMLKAGSVPKRKTTVFAAFRGLRHPSLLSFGLVAIFYNIAFFVILAVSPYPLGFGALGIGLTFCGWGIGLAITSVFAAPALTARFTRTQVIGAGRGPARRHRIRGRAAAVRAGTRRPHRGVGPRTRHHEHRADRVVDGIDRPAPPRGLVGLLRDPLSRRRDGAARRVGARPELWLELGLRLRSRRPRGRARAVLRAARPAVGGE